VLGQRGQVRPARAAEPKLHELPVAFVSAGAEDAAVLRVVGVEEPVLKPIGPALASQVAVDQRPSATLGPATCRADALREDPFLAVVAQLGPMALERTVSGDGARAFEDEREGDGGDGC
jgi:hypothetical protein